PEQIASSPANEGESGGGSYTVQSELYRLQTEKQKNEAQLLLIKRCLSRKRIREIEKEISDLPIVREGDRGQLEKETAREVELLKSTKSSVSCVKSPSETSHPSEVSPSELEKIKIGEGWISTAYVALEAQKKASGGCTIGYGHVIKGRESACAHGAKP